ncbi:MAG: hypothetical protein SVU32_04260 [Candidatus Nanohaloarchaea archaeon]|nr:hypothetical protein [Candidatus Nanohaloarchaea archaeon]
MVALSGIWFGILISLPLPLLSLLLVHRLREATPQSLIFLSLRSRDTSHAMRSFTFGFITLLILRLYYLITPGEVSIAISSIIGTTTSLSITAGLIVLNIIVRGPQTGLYVYLPTELQEQLDRHLQTWRHSTG